MTGTLTDDKARRRKRFSKRLIAIFVVVVFTLCDAVRYAPQGYANPIATIADPVLASVLIPKELGKVEESFRGTAGKTVIFIEDAHDSLEAQENIAKLIGKLVKENGIKTVFEEGYEGSVPTDKFFGFIQDPKIKQKVSYFLLDKLRVGGAEYAHINRVNDFKLIGVEDLELYGENIQSYRTSSRNRQSIDEDLKELFSQIAVLADRYFSKELRRWLKHKDRFGEGQLPLLDYLKRTRDIFLQKCSARMFGQQYPAVTILLAAKSSRDPKLLDQLNTLDLKVVFDEVLRLERDLSKSFLENERDRKIFDYYQALGLLKRLNRIELTQPEYEAAQETLQKFETQELANFIVSLTHHSLVLSKEWEHHIQDAIRFYDVAHGRNRSVDARLREFLRNKEGDSAILVFGGFHASGIKEILRRQGLSYIVISPKITSVDKKHRDYYKRLMSEGRHSFETPLLVARANRSPGYLYLAATGKEEFVRAELRDIASSVKALGENADSLLIERGLAAFDQSREHQLVNAETETSQTRSEVHLDTVHLSAFQPAAVASRRSEMRVMEPEVRKVLDEKFQAVANFLSAREEYMPGRNVPLRDQWTPTEISKLAFLKGEKILVMILGTWEDKVAFEAAPIIRDLRARGYDIKVLTSGKYGNKPGVFFDAQGNRLPEAVGYKQILEKEGVSVDFVEPDSTNSGDNILFSKKKIDEAGYKPDVIIVMQNGLLQKRAGLSIVRQHFGIKNEKEEHEAKSKFDASGLRLISYAPYAPNVSGQSDQEVLQTLEYALKEVEALKNYPAIGYTIPVAIPEDVRQAAADLTAMLAEINKRIDGKAKIKEHVSDLGQVKERLRTKWNEVRWVHNRLPGKKNIPEPVWQWTQDGFLWKGIYNQIDPHALETAIDPNPPAEQEPSKPGWVFGDYPDASQVIFTVDIDGEQGRVLVAGDAQLSNESLLILDRDTHLVLTDEKANLSLLKFHRRSGLKGYINLWGIGQFPRLHDHLVEDMPIFGLPLRKSGGKVDGLEIQELGNYAASTLVYTDDDDAKLAAVMAKTAQELLEEKIPHQVFLAAGKVIFVLRGSDPQTLHKVEGENFAGRYLTGQFVGGVVGYPKASADKITPEKYQDIMRRVSQPVSIRARIISNLQQKGVVSPARNNKRSEMRKDTAEQVTTEIYDPKQAGIDVSVNPVPSGHFRYDQASKQHFWDGKQVLFRKDEGIARESAAPGARTWPVDIAWEEHEKDFAAAHPLFDLHSYGNLYNNAGFVVFDGKTGMLYYQAGEAFEKKAYSMLVSWNDRTVTSENVRFEQIAGGKAGKVQVFVDGQSGPIQDKIRFAVFGQRLIHKGAVVPLEAVADQFEDLFQLYRLPQFMQWRENAAPVYGRTIGVEELARWRTTGDPRDKALFMDVVRHDGYMEIDLTGYLREEKDSKVTVRTLKEIKDGALTPFGYKEVGLAEPQALKRGEYFIQDNRLHIRFLPYPYPHHVLGITASGKVVSVLYIGDKYKKQGVTLQDLPESVRERYGNQEKDPIQELLVIAQGRDSFRRRDGRLAERSPYINLKGTAAILFERIMPPAAPTSQDLLAPRSEMRNADASAVGMAAVKRQAMEAPDPEGFLKVVTAYRLGKGLLTTDKTFFLTGIYDFLGNTDPIISTLEAIERRTKTGRQLLEDVWQDPQQRSKLFDFAISYHYSYTREDRLLELVRKLIEGIQQRGDFASQEKITILDIGTAPKKFGSPTSMQTMEMFRAAFPDKQIELSSVDMQFPASFKFNAEGVYVDERTGIRYVNYDIRKGPLPSADIVIAVNLLDLYQDVQERKRIRKNIFQSSLKYVVTGVKSTEDIFRRSNEQSDQWTKIATVQLMEEWYAQSLYQGLGFSSENIGFQNLAVRNDLYVNYEFMKPLFALLEKTKTSRYHAAFQVLTVLFLRGELEALVSGETVSFPMEGRPLAKYFPAEKDREVIHQFLVFMQDLKKTRVLKNEASNDPNHVIPRFYELINLFILDQHQRGVLPKSGKTLKILLLQARAEPFGYVPAYLPIGLPALTAALKGDDYQARLFSRLLVDPDIYENYLTTDKDVRAIDFQTKEASFEFEKYLSEFKPDIVGIRTVSASIKESQRLARVARAVLGNHAQIHFGGYHITALPEETMAENKGIVDVGFLQEAEESYPHYLAMFVSGQDPASVPGICYYDHTGKLVKTAPRRPVIPFDYYPSFMDFFDMLPDLDRYAELIVDSKHGKITSKMALLVMERGCKAHCAFCPTRIMFGASGIRFDSVETVLSIMEAYYKRGYRIFNFRDDNFTGDRQRVMALSDAIIKKGWKIAWTCMSRADTVDEELLTKMYDSGLSMIAFGVESGSEDILKSMGKRELLWPIRKANVWSRKLGIYYKNYYMVGAPGEQWQHILRTLLFMADSFGGFSTINQAVQEGHVVNDGEYSAAFDGLVKEVSGAGEGLEQFLTRELNFVGMKQDSVNVAYAMPYPGSTWYNQIGKKIWMETDLFRHGPADRDNLGVYKSPTHTVEMTREEISEARDAVVGFYKALEQKDRGKILEILGKVIGRSRSELHGPERNHEELKTLISPSGKRSEMRVAPEAILGDGGTLRGIPSASPVKAVSRARADRMIRSVGKNVQGATVFVDAEDFPNLSLEQKQEYLIVALSNKALHVVVYNEHEQVRDELLDALLKLDRVTRTDKDLVGAQISFDRPNAPSIHLSKRNLPSPEMVQRFRKRIAFFKTQGQNGGTLAAALLWSWSGGEESRLREVTMQDGFWVVAESLVNALQASYESNLAFAVAA